MNKLNRKAIISVTTVFGLFLVLAFVPYPIRAYILLASMLALGFSMIFAYKSIEQYVTSFMVFFSSYKVSEEHKLISKPIMFILGLTLVILSIAMFFAPNPNDEKGCNLIGDCYYEKN